MTDGGTFFSFAVLAAITLAGAAGMLLVRGRHRYHE